MRPESMSNEPRLLIAHVIKGEVQLDAAVEHRSRASASPVMTPALDLDALILRTAEQYSATLAAG